MNPIPLNVKLEQARGRLLETVNQVGAEYGLPAFLLDGLICSVLSDIKEQKSVELMNSYQYIQEQEGKEKEDIENG